MRFLSLPSPSFSLVLMVSMLKLFNFPKRGCPFRRGDKYYYHYNSGLQNHFVMYQLDSLEGERRVFLVR